MSKTSAREGGPHGGGGEGLRIPPPTPGRLRRLLASALTRPGQRWGFMTVAPPLGGAPNSEGAHRRRAGQEGHVTPAPGTNQRPREGATLGAPHPSRRAWRETFSLSFCQLLGGPEPPGPHCGGGHPNRPALPSNTTATPASRPGAGTRPVLGWTGGRRGLGRPRCGGRTRSGAREVGRRGLPVSGPPHQPRVASTWLSGPRPPTPPPTPDQQAPCLPRTPHLGPNPAPQRRSREPHYCVSSGAPQDKISTRCGADRTPNLAAHTGPQSTIQAPPPRCSAIRHPHNGASGSAPGQNPAPPKRCHRTPTGPLHTASDPLSNPVPSPVAWLRYSSPHSSAPQTPSPAPNPSPPSGRARRPPNPSA